MTGFVVQKFGGIAPKVSPKALAEHLAVTAENCRLDRSVLEPLKKLAYVQDLPLNTKVVYPYQGAWETSQDGARYAPTMLANDARDRLFRTDSVYPKMQSGASSYRLGIPAPASPSLSVTLGGDSRVYVVTFVDDWGLEGPPSTPSPVFEIDDGAPITLTLPSPPAGNYNFGPNTLVRIYRSNTGSSGGVYQYVGELSTTDVGFPTFVDTVTNEFLQEALPSVDWIGPPDDDAAKYPDGPLQGLISLSNGALAGFSGNTLYFSDPYLPHAWPSPYRISSSDTIVALVETHQGVIVGTNSAPWFVTGAHPSAMARIPIDIKQACVSAESMVDMGEYAIYASPDGLVQVVGSRASVVTEALFSQDEWQLLQPSTIRAFLYEGLYVGFYGLVSAGTGFIFDPRQGENAFTLLTGLQVESAYSDPNDGQAYVVYVDAGTYKLGRFNSDAVQLAYRWHSKTFSAAKRVGFSVARVEAESYPVEFEVTADGRFFSRVTVQDNKPFRLPSGSVHKTWSFELLGTVRVNYFGIWDSMSEVV